MADRTCPSREQIAAYLENALDSLTSERLAAHVETCQDCQATLQTLCDVDDTLLERLRAPLADSPFVHESGCERAVDRAASEASRHSAANAAGVGTAGELPPVLAQLREYQVLGFIKEGGMGSVYRAVQTRLGRTVAIKLLLRHRTSDPKARARFEREIQLVGKLRHENIVQAYDAREVDGTLLLVMEFLEGMSLGDILRNVGALPVADACELVRQAALGLNHAHTQGLIHRDVKPSNLMLDEQGQVKVLDLGLARLRTDDSTSGDATSSGQLMGTADYIAPEQIQDAHEVDARADIYSLGCTLYALLTGRAPFEGLGGHGSHVAKMMAHLEKEPKPVRDVRADVPAKVATLLQRMMAKDPKNRLATAAEVAEALQPSCAKAELRALLARARTAEAARNSAKPGPGVTPDTVHDLGSAETAGQRRRPIWTMTAVAACFFILVALGIIIRIRTKDGRETVVHAPDDAQVIVEHTTDSSTRTAAAGHREPGKEIPSVNEGAEQIEREPVARKPGEPLSAMALATRPAVIPGAASWTWDTERHRGPIKSLATHPARQWLASGGADGTIRLWNLPDLTLARILVGHDGSVNAVAWSPDGTRLASVSSDGTLRLWDPACGRLLRVLRGHAGSVTDLAWHADGTHLLSVGEDMTLRLWEETTGIQRLSLAGDCRLHAVAWSRDGKYIASEVEDKVIAIREFASRKVVRRLSAEATITALDFSPDSSTLAAADTSGAVRCWDVRSGELVEPAPKPPAATFVEFSPDGARLATAGADGIVQVWELASGGMICQSKTAGDPSTAMTWSGDGQSVISAVSQSRVALRLVDATSGETRAEVTGHVAEARLGSPTSSPDRNLVGMVTSIPGPSAIVVLPTALDTAPTVLEQRFYVRLCAWSPGGKFFAASDCLSTTVYLIDAQSGAVVHSIAAPAGVETSTDNQFCWSPDGANLIICYGAACKDAYVFEASSGNLLRKYEAPASGVSCATYSPDGKLIAATDCHSAWAWNTETGQVQFNIPSAGNLEPHSVVWSRNGELVGVGTAYGSLVVTPSGETVQWLEYPTCCDATGRFFVENDTAFVAARHWDAFYWDLATGSRTDLPACFLPRSHLTGDVQYGAAPTRDGHSLVSTANDNVVRFVTLPSGRLQAAAMFLGPDPRTGLAFNDEGHYRALGELNDNVLYVAETASGQETLTADEFFHRCGWKNDPSRVTLTQPTSSSPPDASETHAQPAAIAADPDSGPAATSETKPGPVSIQPAEPLSARALTMQPAALPGVHSWTLETPVHRGPINSVAYSPDGKIVATGGEDSTVRVWDSTSAKLLRVLHGHNDVVCKVVWSHNGNLLASASADGTVRVWDPATGRMLHVLKGHEGAVRAVAWSPDDSQILTGGADKTLRFRDASTGRPNAVMPMSAAISCLTWLPDGKTVVVADDQKTVQFIEAATKTAVRTLTHDEVVSDMALTGDGQRLVTADTAGSLYVWEVATSTRLLAEAKLSVAGENATDRHPAWVAFSPDGKQLAAGGACRTVRVWEISSGLLAFELKGHTDSVRSLAWSPDGLTIVTACDPADGSMQFWNVSDGNTRVVVDGYRPTPMIPLGWSPDGNTIAYRRGDGSDWFLDTGMSKPAVRAFDQPSICGWSSTGECVLNGSSYGDLAGRFPNGPTIRALRLDTILKNVPVEPTEEAALHFTEFSSDFTIAAVPYSLGGPTQTVRIISLASGDVLQVLKTGNIGRMSLSRDGRTLVTNPFDDKDPRLLVWDTHSGELRHTIPAADLQIGNLGSVAISADGSKLALELPWGVLAVDVATRQGIKWLDHKGLSPGEQVGSPFVWLPDDRRFLAHAYAPSVTNAAYWVFDPENSTKVDLVPPTFVGIDYATEGLPSWAGNAISFADTQFVVAALGSHVLPVWETATGCLHTMLLAYGCQDRPIHFAMDAAGNYAWLTEGQDEMVFVVQSDQRQQLLTPDQFSQRYGWKNDREKLRASAEQGATPPAVTSASEPQTASDAAAQNLAEPAAVKPGERISATALTIAPAPIPGVRAWTIDTPSHRGLVNSISCSPDGQTVATGGEDGTVRLWAAETMQSLRILYGHNHSVWKVMWSHDGTRVASASEDGTIRVWDAATGRALNVLAAHQSVMRTMAWSPDNAQFATAGPDKKLCLLDARSGQVIDVIPMGEAAVACAWNADGRTLAVADDQKTVQLVDVRTHTTLRILPAGEMVSDVQFSADGQYLAAVDTAGTVYLWDTATGNRLLADTRMSVAGEDPNARHLARVAFSPDGKRLAAGGACRSVRVWDTGSAKMACEFTEHTDMIRALAWSPTGQTILTAAGPADHGLRVWNVAAGELVTTIESFRTSQTSYASAWSPDGQVLVTSPSGRYVGLGFGPIQFWDMSLAKPTEAFDAAGSPVHYLWTPDGELVLIDAPDTISAMFQGKTVRKGSLATAAKSVALEPGEEPYLFEAALSWDGTLAAVAYTKTSYIRIFSTVSQELVATLKGHTKLPRGLAFHPDNKRLVSSSFEDLTMRHWDVTTGQQTQLIDTRWPGNEGTGYVAWSPDGERCAFSGLWCVGGLDTLLSYPHPSCYTNPTVWLPSGKKLVSMGLLFDCDKEKGTPLKSPYFSTAPSEEGWSISSASPDSRLVAVPEGPNYNVIWDVESVKVHAVLVTYQCGDQYDCVATNPAGHHVWLSPGKDPLVYVVLTDAGQETLTPEEFAQRYAWQNDPAQLRLSAEQGAAPPPNTRPTTSPPVDGVAAQNPAEPASVKPGERISATALTIAPAPIPGVRAWTIDTPSHRGLINSIAFSPDGHTVATGGEDGTVRLWAAETMQSLRVMYGHNHSVWKVMWSHDGTRVASASEDGTIRVWDAATGGALKVLAAHQNVLRTVAWSPNNAQFVTAGPDKKLCLLDAQSGQVIDAIPMNEGAVACAWNADGRTLAVANDQKTVQLVDVRTHSTLRILPADETVSDVQFSSDGQYLAAVDTAGTVYLWDTPTGNRLLADTRMSVAGEDPNARHPAWVAFSPDGKRLAAGGACRTVRVWDTSSAKMVHELAGHTDLIRALTWSPDGLTVITAAGQWDVGMRTWNAATGELASTMESYRCLPETVCSAWSPDGQVLITSPPGQGPVQFWDMTMVRPTATCEWPGHVTGYLWKPDGQLVLVDAPDTAPAEFLGRRYERASLAALSNSVALEPDEQTYGMTAFSRDGRLAAVAYRNTNHIRVFSMATQELLCTLKGHTKTIHGLAIHPDGEQLVSSSLDDCTLRIWKVTTGEQLTIADTRSPANPGVGYVAWAPDGSCWAGNMPWGLGGLGEFLGYGEMGCPYDPVVWLPDGKKLLARGMLFDRASGSFTRLTSPFGALVGGQSPCLPSASPDSRLVALPESRNCVVIWDVDNVKALAALISLKRGDQYDCLATNPAGHHVWLSSGKDPLVYVVLTDAGQETLTPDEFAQRFGWQNDPAQLQLTP